jgi:phosphatidylserine decarboxylase
MVPSVTVLTQTLHRLLQALSRVLGLIRAVLRGLFSPAGKRYSVPQRPENSNSADNGPARKARREHGMRQSSMGLALEGVPLIAFGGLATLTFGVLEWGIPALAALVLTYLVLHFFRDPERVVPTDAEVAVSPADGKVVSVSEVRDPLSGEIRPRVGIFMNVLNVHVNRSPIAGRVTQVNYQQGKFGKADGSGASGENERNILRITDREDREWTVVQVAGLVARRIVCWAEEGDEVARGQRIGMIKFGSKVDLYLPRGYDATVSMGERVYAGQSVLAWKKVQQGAQ